MLETYGWIEPVVTLAAALSASLLGVLGDRNSVAIPSATLGVLSLLSLNFARDRAHLHRLEEQLQDRRLGTAGCTDTPRGLVLPFAADTRLDLDGVHEVRLMGVTLNRTLRRHLIQLEQFVATGGCVKIALIDPAGPGPDEAARRSSIPSEQRTFEHRLAPTLALIDRLSYASDKGGQLEVRLLDFVPAFGLAITLTESGDSRIVVEVYSHCAVGPETVACVRRRHDPELFQHFCHEFRQVWTAGRVSGLGPLRGVHSATTRRRSVRRPD